MKYALEIAADYAQTAKEARHQFNSAVESGAQHPAALYLRQGVSHTIAAAALRDPNLAPLQHLLTPEALMDNQINTAAVWAPRQVNTFDAFGLGVMARAMAKNVERVGVGFSLPLATPEPALNLVQALDTANIHHTNVSLALIGGQQLEDTRLQRELSRLVGEASFDGEDAKKDLILQVVTGAVAAFQEGTRVSHPGLLAQPGKSMSLAVQGFGLGDNRVVNVAPREPITTDEWGGIMMSALIAAGVLPADVPAPKVTRNASPQIRSLTVHFKKRSEIAEPIPLRDLVSQFTSE